MKINSQRPRGKICLVEINKSRFRDDFASWILTPRVSGVNFRCATSFAGSPGWEKNQHNAPLRHRFSPKQPLNSHPGIRRAGKSALNSAKRRSAGSDELFNNTMVYAIFYTNIFPWNLVHRCSLLITAVCVRHVMNRKKCLYAILFHYPTFFNGNFSLLLPA